MTSTLHKLIVINRAGFHTKIAPIGKRGSILSRLVSNKDKRKHWHLDVLAKPNTPKINIFEKVHKPNRRTAVLNTLFIENITDVLSTGDICPEIIGSGIEIMEVKISSDFKILNVYWQIPLSKLDMSQDLKALLAMSAPKIRAELISRNVLGRVPKIYFVQDTSNESLVEFQKALASADLGPDADSATVPDQEFLNDLLVFKSARERKNEKLKAAKAGSSKEVKAEDLGSEMVQEQDHDKPKLQPKPPEDMKMDVFGLNHKSVMDRVMASKKKAPKEVAQVSIPTDASKDDDDLFSKIPGQPLFRDEEREKLLVRFCIERKIQKKKGREMNDHDDEADSVYVQQNCDTEEAEHYEPDYYEEEDNSR